MSENAMAVLFRDYPKTAGLLDGPFQDAMKRLPESERVRWMHLLREFIETYCYEAEQNIARRHQLLVADAIAPGKT